MTALRLAFLDVGQGDCTVLCVPDTDLGVVIDCPEGADEPAEMQMRDMGVQFLDTIFVTHSDHDHAAGVPDLIRRFGGCRQVAYVEDRMWRGDTPVFKHRLFRQQLAVALARAPDQRMQPTTKEPLKLGDLTIEFVHPTDVDRLQFNDIDYRNQTSLVIKLVYANHSLLLGADVRGRGWQAIAERGADISASLLKVSHHGGWDNEGLPLSEVVRLVGPDLAVLSVGTNNRYGHPDRRTVSALLATVPSIWIACTEVTRQCHSEVTAVEELADRLLPMLPRKAASGGSRCCGTLMVEVSETGLITSPTRGLHQTLVSRLDSPMCRSDWSK